MNKTANKEGKSEPGTALPGSRSELGRRIEAVSALLGTRINAAQVAGISTDQLSRYINGDGEVSLTPIAKMCDAAGVRIDWVWSATEPMMAKDYSYSKHSDAIGDPRSGKHGENDIAADGFVMVPRFDVQGSAGHGSVAHSEQIVDYIAFRSDWVRNALGVPHKDLVLITIKGDSMEPTLSNGDLILVDTGAHRVDDSAIYVLRKLDSLFVKRLQHKLDGTVIVKCDNQLYDSETYSAEAASALAVVGRVVWAGRKL